MCLGITWKFPAENAQETNDLARKDVLYFAAKSLKIKLIFSVSEEFENKNFFAEDVFFRIFLNTFWVSLTHHRTEVAHQPGSFKGIVWKVREEELLGV